MIVRTLAAVLAVWLGMSPPAAIAQSDDFVSGQVTKIDESAGKITIKHGPLKKFDMDEGMTMVFRAGDPAMLKAVKPGDRIRFVPDRINGQFTVTQFRRTTCDPQVRRSVCKEWVGTRFDTRIERSSTMWVRRSGCSSASCGNPATI